MQRILFHAGPWVIRSYGLMLMLAFLAWMLVSMDRLKKRGLDPRHAVHVTLIAFLSAACGGRLFFYLLHPHRPREGGLFFPQILFNPGEGFSLVGGLLLALVTMVLYTRLVRLPFLRFLDALTPGFGVGLFFAKLGCFLNGCCYGKPTTLPWGLRFPLPSPAGWAFLSVPIHPVQLYEAFLGLLFFLIFLLLDRKPRFDGALFSIAGILYFPLRFFLDFLRAYPPQDEWMGLVMTQWAALLLFGASGGLAIIFRYLARRQGAGLTISR